MTISNAINDTQRRFNRPCELGGGRAGGPARTKVQELLKASGLALNVMAREEIEGQFAVCPGQNPWHICFALGLCWGHLARVDERFTRAAVQLLSDWNDQDLRVARQFPYERGPEPIEQSLRGGYMLFRQVNLPEKLPDTLSGYKRAQERWLGVILHPDRRPPYIGSWNATALFMIGLFSNPPLGDRLLMPEVMLPPGGPIYNALSILHRTHVVSRPPAGSELDDESFEPGAIYENNALFEEVLRGMTGWSLLDVHSGLYMLGTRLAESATWFRLP